MEINKDYPGHFAFVLSRGIEKTSFGKDEEFNNNFTRSFYLRIKSYVSDITLISPEELDDFVEAKIEERKKEHRVLDDKQTELLKRYIANTNDLEAAYGFEEIEIEKIRLQYEINFYQLIVEDTKADMKWTA